MSETRKTVAEPVTKQSLIEGFRKLGVTSNQIIEVHSRLSSFDYVLGGARTVVDALMEIASDGGTILMPIQSSDNTEPSGWTNPPIAASFYREARESMPAYDSYSSDIPNMGRIAENFRPRQKCVYGNTRCGSKSIFCSSRNGKQDVSIPSHQVSGKI